VIYDSGLSLSAKAIYAYLSRHVYQGNVVKCGQRLIARKMGANKETVNLALHELQERGHISIRGKGKARRIYILHSNLFGQKQRAGVESLIVSGPKSAPRKRLATVRSA
jgi:DNA-binding MarR family transcriptional regulator